MKKRGRDLSRPPRWKNPGKVKGGKGDSTENGLWRREMKAFHPLSPLLLFHHHSSGESRLLSTQEIGTISSPSLFRHPKRPVAKNPAFFPEKKQSFFCKPRGGGRGVVNHPPFSERCRLEIAAKGGGSFFLQKVLYDSAQIILRW